jgi:hypothetical protein
MNKNTKIIIGVGAAAALLFFFRKQIFGGGNGGNGGQTTPDTNGRQTTPDTTGPSADIEAPKDTEETWTEPWIRTAKPPINPSVIDVNSAYSPGSNLTSRVDSAVFFSAPNPTALGGK